MLPKATLTCCASCCALRCLLLHDNPNHPMHAAPQYGSAKSVANIAGMVASNVLRGDHPVVHWQGVDWEAIRDDLHALIVDVREVSEVGWRLGPAVLTLCAIHTHTVLLFAD